MKKLKQVRDTYIDTMKGICIICIIFIHTCFHSGESYVPLTVKNISLLFDVPIFFLLTGCIMSIYEKFNPIKQIAKLIGLFFIITLIGELITGIVNLKSIIAPLALNFAYIKGLNTYNWSYWFIPVYVIALLYMEIIRRYLNKYVQYFILAIIPVYYIYSYFTDYMLNIGILGIRVQMELFYIWCMLLGLHLYNQKSKILSSTLLGIGIISFIFINVILNFDLQISKFGVSLPYFLISLTSIGLVLILPRSINLKPFSKIGERAIYFYITQGFGGSLLYLIVPYLQMPWQIKLPICFMINICISIAAGYLLWYIGQKATKLVTIKGK